MPVYLDLLQMEVLRIEQLNADVSPRCLFLWHPNERACPRWSTQQGVCLFAKYGLPRLIIVGNLNFYTARASENGFIRGDAIVDPHLADLLNFVQVDAPPRGRVESGVAVV